jgi:hypothetical protein
VPQELPESMASGHQHPRRMCTPRPTMGSPVDIAPQISPGAPRAAAALRPARSMPSGLPAAARWMLSSGADLVYYVEVVQVGDDFVAAEAASYLALSALGRDLVCDRSKPREGPAMGGCAARRLPPSLAGG